MARKKSGVDEIVERWRGRIARKRRRIISFEETIEAKIESLRAHLCSDAEPLDTWEIRQFHYTNRCERVFIDDAWRPIRVGQTWGGEDVSALFRCTARMPPRFAGRKVVLKLYFSGDGLLYLNGQPYQGLDPFRDTVWLTDCAAGDEVYELQAESFIKWHFGEGKIKTFECSHFAVVDAELHEAYWDLMAAYFVMVAEDAVEPAAREFVRAGLTKAVQGIDQNAADGGAVRDAALQARRIIRREVYDTDVFRGRGLMHLCGHSHLDLVYVWPYAEFLRKIGRTHATALRLMEQYPEYVFSQSQPLMYREMKRLYPALFSQVRQRVAQGRWEVIGAFWVEPDCNLISGESFVRQILFGLRFIEREFGTTTKTAWIPDVFGNAWTMPQILLRSGLKYFVTHKMSTWNDTNPWNRSVFWWQGPDGSRIFATVPPSHFIGTMDPVHMRGHWDAFSEKDAIGETIYCYGWGDGGGGPDTLMLECARRYRSFPGLPATKTGTVEEALERMCLKAARADICVHNDELYLEEHRGVHTTKARLKKLNRYCEGLYRKAEMFSCFAALPYPAEALRSGWEDVLTNQFHDSLPGTHLTSVYADLLAVYDRACAAGEQVLRAALGEIASRADTAGEGRAAVVFNSQPFARETLVRIETQPRELRVVDPEGRDVPHQFISHFATGRPTLVFRADLPPCGYAVYRLVEGEAAPAGGSDLAVTPTTLENEHLRVAVNGRGELVSLYDKHTGRECLDRARGGNVLEAFEDEPGQYDAWDIVSFYERYPFALSAEAEAKVVEAGPVRAAIQVTRPILGSRLVQRIVLAAGGRRVDFETWIDWRESHKLLKTRFYTTVVSRHATYDIAFGNIDRPCYANNSFDAARFEVPAHLWMDMSQADYGVSLLNDCKYGHQAKENMICLTLLRSPKDPDAQSDMEEHTFTYAVYPHAGSWRDGHTHRQALDLNDPVDVVLADSHAGELPARHWFAAVDAPAVTLEALKKAEDSDAWIVRLVERYGSQADVTVRFARPVACLAECDLMERRDEALEAVEGQIRFVARPYEIRTFKVEMPR